MCAVGVGASYTPRSSVFTSEPTTDSGPSAISHHRLNQGISMTYSSFDASTEIHSRSPVRPSPDPGLPPGSGTSPWTSPAASHASVTGSTHAPDSDGIEHYPGFVLRTTSLMRPRVALVEASVHRSTRHHRCDYGFLELLEEDFGISQFSLRQAFMGVPPAPKKQASEVCEWATRCAGDPEEAGRMVRGWAKNRQVGMYHPAIVGAPELTWEQSAHERRVMRGAGVRPASAPREVHHRVARCVLGLWDQADACADPLSAEGLALWMGYELEALHFGVNPDMSRDELAALIEGSTVEIPREEHRNGHADDFARWGKRGGLVTVRRYGTAWFGLLAWRSWERITAEELSTVFAAMKGGWSLWGAPSSPWARSWRHQGEEGAPSRNRHGPRRAAFAARRRRLG